MTAPLADVCHKALADEFAAMVRAAFRHEYDIAAAVGVDGKAAAERLDKALGAAVRAHGVTSAAIDRILPPGPAQ